MRVLVAYDVVKDRRRRKLARKLEGLLTRVQYSVFEGELSEPEWRRIEEAILNCTDPDEDSVRVHHLCRRCLSTVTTYGPSIEPPSKDGDLVA